MNEEKEHPRRLPLWRGQKGNQFVILRPAANTNVVDGYSRAAVDALKRGVILGTNTRLDTLSESERRRHEAILERVALRAALVQRSGEIGQFVKKKNPALLGLPSSGE